MIIRDDRHNWHVAINAFHKDKWGDDRSGWMYEAKEASAEVPRLTLLFKMARCGELPKIHRQCSHSTPEPIPENHLTCCLGVRCDACPQLLALDGIQAVPEVIDEAKAWTCVTHIISKGGDVAREGYVLTTDDRMYWDRVYESMAMGEEPKE
jgi:hypothetical protein